MSEEVIRLTSIRDQTPRSASDAADLRLRALTLVDQAYDEARRVVTFLRWHEGDADEILPPLRTHAARRKRSAGDAGGRGATGGAGGGASGDDGATRSGDATADAGSGV